jgi:phosphohistidine phosphatase
MKRLLLLRHAKAAPGIGRDDFERELTASGEVDARGIGDFLASHDLIPELILYSGARRTRETAEIVIGRLNGEVERQENNGLYDASRYLILALLRQISDKFATVLVVGHNPGMSEVAYSLSGAGDKPIRQRLAAKYPTCGLAVLEFEGDSWAGLAAHVARLEAFVTPADLGLRES